MKSFLHISGFFQTTLILISVPFLVVVSAKDDIEKFCENQCQISVALGSVAGCAVGGIAGAAAGYTITTGIGTLLWTSIGAYAGTITGAIKAYTYTKKLCMTRKLLEKGLEAQNLQTTNANENTPSAETMKPAPLEMESQSLPPKIPQKNEATEINN